MRRVLLLGGTTEASQLARALAGVGVEAMFSYAGRTGRPIIQPLPTRVGGFGGVAGLVDYLSCERFTHVIDATHSFAAQMSRHAVLACAETGTPYLAFERAPWRAGPGDDWRHVSDIDTAVAALPEAPTRVFLAIGRQNLAAFAARPQHFYLLRLVDAPPVLLPLPDAAVVLARGPFTPEGDLALMRVHRITLVVAKNSGGEGGRAKLEAARVLGVPVIMIGRPRMPERPLAHSVDEVMRWLGHSTRLEV
jgi:precorrin-6A/cobalt-precorrin-6A reductase